MNSLLILHCEDWFICVYLLYKLSLQNRYTILFKLLCVIKLYIIREKYSAMFSDFAIINFIHTR